MTTDQLQAEVRRLQGEVDAARAELALAKRAIESDRTMVCDAIRAVKKELDSRYWLTEGRGSYEWDDDRYREEFLAAGRSLLEAMKPLDRIAADLTNSPMTSDQVVEARRNLEAELAQAKQEIAGLREHLDAILNPTKEHIDSIAMRLRHNFGLMSEYQKEGMRSMARQVHEESVGLGFYRIDAARKEGSAGQ